MERNGEKFNKFVLSAAFMMLGMLVSGMVGVVRGDWLGQQAAIQVETRTKERLDRELGYLKDDLREIKEKIDRLDELIRSKQ